MSDKGKKINKVGVLAASLVLPQLAGFVGSLFTTPAIPTWYAGLNKPSFSPPNWLFAPVWLLLYLLMGISLYIIWIKSAENLEAKTARNIFLVHLVFNASWSILFFGLNNPLLGLFNIITIWCFILYLIKAFFGLDKRAAFLLFPYLLWVSFASILNFSIYMLN